MSKKKLYILHALFEIHKKKIENHNTFRGASKVDTHKIRIKKALENFFLFVTYKNLFVANKTSFNVYRFYHINTRLDLKRRLGC
jgi:hypothetical protein